MLICFYPKSSYHIKFKNVLDTHVNFIYVNMPISQGRHRILIRGEGEHGKNFIHDSSKSCTAIASPKFGSNGGHSRKMYSSKTFEKF